MSAGERVWLVPPHRDATLIPVAPEGWRVRDLQAEFATRVLAPAGLAQAAAALRGRLGGATQPSPPPSTVVELEAAWSVLSRPGLGRQSRLRAQGVALAALTRSGPLRLRLDDVELADGTTERSADLVALSTRAESPWEPELEAALEEARGAEQLRVVVECDQRLPFVFTLLTRLGPQGAARVWLCGPFAQLHQETLRRCFPQVTCSPLLPAFRVEGAEWDWAWDGALLPAGRWAGYAPRPSGLEHCALAVVPFLAVEEGRLLTLEGEWIPQERWTGRGIPVVGEWQFGAPGVGEALFEATAAALTSGAFGSWVAGLRRFHWSRGRPVPASWLGAPLSVGPADPTRDLARSLPVLDPPGLAEGPLWKRVGATLTTLTAGAHPPSPGRVAGGLSQPPPAPPPRGEWLRLAADAAVIDLPVAMDGRPQRTVVAASLRSGQMLALDARLWPHLSRLAEPRPPGELFAGLPAAPREKLISTLTERGILEGVPS